MFIEFVARMQALVLNWYVFLLTFFFLGTLVYAALLTLLLCRPLAQCRRVC